jgi:S-adenosyl methyltransferase
MVGENVGMGVAADDFGGVWSTCLRPVLLGFMTTGLVGVTTSRRIGRLGGGRLRPCPRCVRLSGPTVRFCVAWLLIWLPGSFVALSHAADDDDLPAEQARMIADYQRSTRSPFVHREPEELARWLDGLDLVPPGIVLTNQWHPDQDAEKILRTYGVLARKPPR